MSVIKNIGKTERSGKTFTFVNHYSYLILRKNPDILNDFDSINVDGIFLCQALKLIGINKSRSSFDMTSLAPLVFESAQKNADDIYFIGSENGIVEKAIDSFKSKYPALQILGYRHGFFSTNEERNETINNIKTLNPKIVIVGMGTPFQEKFLIDLVNTGWAGTGYTCGGFLHQTAKSGLIYYPEWINKYNLRWAYRVYDEPKLIRRYTLDFIKFLLFFSYDAFIYKIKK